MNYMKIYHALISFRQSNIITKDQQYCETHHIVPKSLGGSNAPTNLVNLTAREHYIAHLLLWKHYKQSHNKAAYIKMAYAIGRLMTGNKVFIENLNRHFNSRLYEKFRKELANIKRECQLGKQLKDRNVLYNMLLPLFNVYKYDLTQINYGNKKAGYGNFDLVKDLYDGTENSFVNKLIRYVPEFREYAKELLRRKTVMIIYESKSYTLPEFINEFNISRMIIGIRINNYFKHQQLEVKYPLVITTKQQFDQIFTTKYYSHETGHKNCIWINNGEIETMIAKNVKLPTNFKIGRKPRQSKL